MTEMTSGIGNSAASRDKAYYLHPYTNLKTHEDVGPLVIERGEGVHVFDDSGKAYIEGMAGLWCTSLGFGEERLVEAATRQMRKLPFYHAFTHKAHDPDIDLAEALIKIAPVPMSKVFFCQLRFRGQRYRRQAGLVLQQRARPPAQEEDHRPQKGYHGVTVAVGQPDRPAAICTATSTCRSPAIPPHRLPALLPLRRGRRDGGRFRDPLADQLEQLILAEGPDTIAAFIAEPVMGAGGVIVPPQPISTRSSRC